MGGGGGKGGGQTQKTEIPKWVEEPAKRNLARAEQAQQVGYMPYYGLDVAAFNPTQTAAQQMNIDAANAFGMMPAGSTGLTAGAGMPATQTIGGMTGYSASPMYDAAVAAATAKDPTQAQLYGSLFGEDLNYTPTNFNDAWR